jgi:hypothetical protein
MIKIHLEYFMRLMIKKTNIYGREKYLSGEYSPQLLISDIRLTHNPSSPRDGSF